MITVTLPGYRWPCGHLVQRIDYILGTGTCIVCAFSKAISERGV